MMKRIAALLTLLPALLFAACGGKDIALTIYVPPGSGEEFAYSHEEISSDGGSITLSCGEGLGDTEVALLPVDDTRPPEPFYLTPGMPVTVEVEKGKWYKVGVRMENTGDKDASVSVQVQGVVARIE